MIDDDQLMAMLRESAAEYDPVPELVIETARAALSTRRLDEEFAELLMDSAATPGLVRADEDDVRLLSFGTERVSVELQLQLSGATVSVRGLVFGASGELTIEQSDARHTVPIDTDGWFALTGLPRGATRMHLNATDGGLVTTGWVLF